MKLRFFLGILLAVCIYSNASSSVNDTVCLKCSGRAGETVVSACSCQIDSSTIFDAKLPDLEFSRSEVIRDTNNLGSKPPSDVVSLITLIVNDFNNVLSEINNSFALISIIIGIFGLLIGVLGILGFSNLKNDYRELKKGLAEQISDQNTEIRERIREIEGLRTNIEARSNEIVGIQNWQNYQNQYLQRINQYLFSITNSIVDSNGGDDEIASDIRKILYNQYYVVKTFFPWSDSPIDGTEAAFRYLKVNGTEENIIDLQFIADNDPDERKRNMARETIGYISARLMNEQA